MPEFNDFKSLAQYTSPASRRAEQLPPPQAKPAQQFTTAEAPDTMAVIISRVHQIERELPHVRNKQSRRKLRAERAELTQLFMSGMLSLYD